MNTPQTLKGFRDFLPETMAVRNYVKNLVVNVFESFGFEPLETPTLEYASTLLGKYGTDADKLVYKFTDAGGREIGLRYDLTVPVSKVLAIYKNQIPLPFKRYQIQPVWRADKPQKGRYREILQCDIDTFGSISPTADAEIVALIYQILVSLKFSRFSIRINSRSVLTQILNQSGLLDQKSNILQSIDKLDKISQDGVTKELVIKGLSPVAITSLFNSIKQAQPDNYLKQVLDQIKLMGVPQDAYVFDPTMVRGLDYYTGPIFETYVQEPKIGSVTGGGRYDNLIATLGGPDIPAVGTTIGLDRIVDVITELNLLPNLPKTTTRVLVTNFGPETEKETIDLVTQLRANNVNTLLYPTLAKLSKQFKYASDRGIPFVAVIGPDELTNKMVTLKNLVQGTQQSLNLTQTIDQVKSG